MMNHFKTQLLLIVLISTNYPSIFCQSHGFDLLITTDQDEEILDISQDSWGNYYLVGSRNIPYLQNLDLSKGLIYKLNPFGNVIDSCVLTQENKASRLMNIDLINDNEFIVSGYSNDTSLRYYKSSIDFYKVDTELNILKSYSIILPDSFNIRFGKQSITFDNEILLNGYVIQGYNKAHPRKGYLGRLSLDLDSISFQFLQDSIWFVNTAHKLKNGEYLLAGGYMSFVSMFNYIYVDSSFNYIKHYPIPESVNPFHFISDSDTSLYLVNIWGEGDDRDISMIYQKDMDSIDSYNIIKSGTVDTTDIPGWHLGVDFKNKDSIYICGTTNFAFGQSLYSGIPSWYYIAQLDSLLNIRWERFYGGDAYYVAFSVNATSDGGCIITGSKYDYLNTIELQKDVYILKVNNQGLITGSTRENTLQTKEAIIYPNPGTDYLNIRIGSQRLNSIINIYNITGTLILSENINSINIKVNTSNLPQGTYFYTLKSKNVIFESGKWIKNR